MDCLFFRHGIAIERQEWSGQEQDRPLTDKGAARTRESGKGLLNLRIKPTHILSSPLVRAHETAVILQSLIRSKPKIRICSRTRVQQRHRAPCSRSWMRCRRTPSRSVSAMNLT
jgi:phosphohistidine phosphatase